MKHPTRVLAPLLAGALLVSPQFASAQTGAPVSVVVDGRPVDFGSSPPVSSGGRLLVPLRAIFESLGAQVDFAGGVVRARRGATNLELALGSSNAVVNGQTRVLDVPAQAIFGRTFVPLRFVGEAFGAGVSFNTASQIVTISSPSGGTGVGNPTQPTTPIYTVPGTAQTITGTLLRLDAEAPASLSILVDGQIRNFPINENALVLRQISLAQNATTTPVRQPPRAATLSSLVPNETLRLVLDQNGRVSQLTAQATVVVARVQYGAGNQIILDDAGDTTLTLGANLGYTDATGRAASTVNIAAGQTVALFLSPQGRTIYRVSSDPRDFSVQTTTGVTDPLPGGSLPPANAPTVGLVQTDATSPLKAGSVLNVSVRATTGQRVSMSLGPRVQNVVLPEDPAQPGIYRGAYTVRAGDDVLDARVSVRLVGQNGFEATAQSQKSVTIDTVPPRLVGTFPANNATINVAQPNIAIFADDLGGSGLASASVTVTSNGVATPIPATVAPPTSVNAVPPQPLAGRVSVRAVVADAAGNTLPVNFGFTVAQGGVVGAIRSFTQGATRAITPGEDIPLVLTATTGGRASFDVVGPRNILLARDLPLAEDDDTPGTYRASFRVPDGTTGNVRFVGKFDAGDGQTVQSEATAPVRILAAAVPTKLTIDTPTGGGQVQSPFVVSGKAAPGATVNVSVAASGTQFFVLQYQNDLGTFQARADAAGNWQTQPIPFAKPRNVQGLALTISATQTDAANRTSEPVEISVSP